MPNHCYNRVTLSNNGDDDSKQFDELVAKFQSDRPFSKILPQPDFSKIKNEDGELPVVHEHKNDKGEVIFTTSEFPKSGKSDSRWYDWNINNWGTKWDIDGTDSEIDGDDYSFQVCFETAWSPPEQIYYALREKYGETVDITWFFDEPGAQCAGYLGS